jgi:hypothetical protein
MKEHKGENTTIWRLFLGFGYVLTGVSADRLISFFRWTGFFCPSVLEPFSNA